LLDNEHPDTNSDGVQLHLIVPAAVQEGGARRELDWLLVPELGGNDVRVSARAVGGAALLGPRLWTKQPRSSGGEAAKR